MNIFFLTYLRELRKKKLKRVPRPTIITLTILVFMLILASSKTGILQQQQNYLMYDYSTLGKHVCLYIYKY